MNGLVPTVALRTRCSESSSSNRLRKKICPRPANMHRRPGAQRVNAQHREFAAAPGRQPYPQHEDESCEIRGQRERHVLAYGCLSGDEVEDTYLFSNTQ